MIRPSLCIPKYIPNDEQSTTSGIRSIIIEGDERHFHATANRLFPLIFFPYLKKIYGNGIMPTVKKASKLVAHWSPRAWYIWTPKSGNTAEDHGQP
jgi:hypothetical protein